MNSLEILKTEHELLAKYAKAISHPIRVYILYFLAKQACCFSGDLDKILPIARSTLSQHLKELKKAGLIKGNIEYPKIRYCLNTDNWEEAKKLFENFFGK
ncbi:MAG: winged helix-turn-helix transcriptional regulator [Bacteroidales bacterium]|nr:winged helix-turn-helix transcriptional regulator [Bacteroidales bacterium]MBN2756511.1 winged helix-turn-helix transcriptional regulator [Bacteroidales bacterium]